MRHELLLFAVMLIYIIAEIVTPKGKKGDIKYLALGLLLLHTIIGFIPMETGVLFGGMFRNTGLTIVMKNILNIGALLVFFQASNWLSTSNETKGRISEFYILLVSTLLGMYYMISAGDFLMFYIGIELASIPLAALAAYELYKRKSAEAGLKYIMMAAMSSSIMLFGISFLYGTTGSIYFDAVMSVMADTPMQVFAFLFFFVGLAFKISLVPFHFWTADVYEGAPVSVTSYLSVVSKGAAAFILMILLFTVFQAIGDLWKDVLWVISILTMTIGNLFAIRQKNLKRFLAFSSIAQAGFIMLGLISGTQAGMASVLYFVLIYIFSNLGAFGVVQAVTTATGKEEMDDYNGFYLTNPKLSLVMLLSLFSLAGIPPVAGFFGKFFLFTVVAEQGYYWLVFIAVLNTIVSLYYYLLIVKAMFVNKTDKPIGTIQNDLFTKIGLAVSVIGIIVIGIYSPIFNYLLNLSFGM